MKTRSRTEITNSLNKLKGVGYSPIKSIETVRQEREEDTKVNQLQAKISEFDLANYANKLAGSLSN